MSQRLTQSVDSEIVVILTDTSNVPVTGLTDTDVSCQYRKAGAGSFTAKTITGVFAEIGSGVYTILFTAAELDTLGSFTVRVFGGSIQQSITIADVVSVESTDVL